jgi:putative flippase GtrA
MIQTNSYKNILAHGIQKLTAENHFAQFIRYLISGFLVGLFYFVLGLAFVELVKLDMPIAVTLAYLVTTPFAFALHKTFTFKTENSLSEEILRFVLVGVVLFVLSKVLQTYVSLPIPVFLQIIFFWLLGSILNYLAYKFWVFSIKKQDITPSMPTKKNINLNKKRTKRGGLRKRSKNGG